MEQKVFDISVIFLLVLQFPPGVTHLTPKVWVCDWAVCVRPVMCVQAAPSDCWDWFQPLIRNEQRLMEHWWMDAQTGWENTII